MVDLENGVLKLMRIWMSMLKAVDLRDHYSLWRRVHLSLEKVFEQPSGDVVNAERTSQ
jgi:hypothetical protein